MDLEKQTLLLEYLVSSPDTFAICQGIVNSKYFDPELRNVVTFVKHYYEQYNTTPEVNQVKAETGVQLTIQQISNDKIEYCTNEIEIFCRRRALEEAILASPELIEKGNYAQVETNIRDAILISLNKNLGLRYFDNPEDRLQRMLENNPVTSTGWPSVDELLFGGIARKEMILFAGNSGAGKSVTLANLGFNFIQQYLIVLVVSLELSEDVIAQRYDTMYTGISRKDWKSHVSEIATRIESESETNGTLDIVRMESGTTANNILAYLKEYYLHYDMMPDLLVVDYLDKMNPNEKMDMSDVWTKDKMCSEQLRDIGEKHNMFIATASQLNRSAVGATHHDHSQIAGGISKINETDVYISLIATDSMKTAGDIAFCFQKTRNSNGVGETLYLNWDEKYLRVTDRTYPADEIKFKKREKAVVFDDEDNKKPTTNDLLSLMTSNT